MTLTTPLAQAAVDQLQAGDTVNITGTIYTARDAAHGRMFETLNQGEEAPFDYTNNLVFYAGPCPTPPGKAMGAIGPTTAGRMDAYAPALIEAGLKYMLAKGDRSPEVVSAIKAHQGAYFVAIGGAAALLAKRITASKVIAYDDLGTEAIRQLTVVDFPVIVAIDTKGRSIFD